MKTVEEIIGGITGSFARVDAKSWKATLSNPVDKTKINYIVEHEDRIEVLVTVITINAKLYESADGMDDFIKTHCGGMGEKEAKRWYGRCERYYALFNRLFATDEERSELKGNI